MNDTTARPDDAARRELILRCKQGDQRAFAQLVAETQQMAFGLALRLLADEEEARDAVQDGFLAAWTHLAEFDENRRFTTWLYSIISNRCLDRLRARKRARLLFRRRESDEEFPASRHAHPESSLANAELVQHIRRLTVRLSPSQRLVFVLRDLEELTVPEVAAVTGMTADTIKTHLSAARRALRRLLKEHDQIEGMS